MGGGRREAGEGVFLGAPGWPFPFEVALVELVERAGLPVVR